MFKNNVGNTDRIMRVIVGVVVLALFFVFPDSEWRWLALIGFVPLVTGLMGSCLIYTVFGFSTCPLKHE